MAPLDLFNRMYQTAKLLNYGYCQVNYLTNPADYQYLALKPPQIRLKNPASKLRNVVIYSHTHVALFRQAANLQHQPSPLRLYTYTALENYSQLAMVIMTKKNPLGELALVLKNLQLETIINSVSIPKFSVTHRLVEGDSTIEYGIMDPANSQTHRYFGFRALTNVAYVRCFSNSFKALA